MHSSKVTHNGSYGFKPTGAVQGETQEHLATQLGGAGDPTSNLPVKSQPALSHGDPQYSCNVEILRSELHVHHRKDTQQLITFTTWSCPALQCRVLHGCIRQMRPEVCLPRTEVFLYFILFLRHRLVCQTAGGWDVRGYLREPCLVSDVYCQGRLLVAPLSRTSLRTSLRSDAEASISPR